MTKATIWRVRRHMTVQIQRLFHFSWTNDHISSACSTSSGSAGKSVSSSFGLVSFDRRFQEIRASLLLILDNLKESGASTPWAEDKLHSLLNYRYNSHLPTVLTSALSSDSFALSYPNLWNKLLNSSRCQILSINMPSYRRMQGSASNNTNKEKRVK